ncbi:hypothetical protein [Pseudolactococcus reticulitermitis]|uniref:Uncharacterized protein n=1 Tax=Pseudolactococcus reticulitermitis TaxID=2025039 RepID=A0A224X9S6_9LACT|nr:hypothetical protein [Lactococcus reticulitermitis]GAX48020.1 hypothetical protein RsY01_1634 [Lactococcus reticulitermitis]
MFYLGIALIIGLLAYFMQDKGQRKMPLWLKVILILVVLYDLAMVSEKLSGIAVLALLVWWFVRRPSRQKRQELKAAAKVEAMRAKNASAQPIDPIKRYVSTPKRQEALAELDSTPKELAAYIHQEIDTFFMNEWTKMSVIYTDQSDQFDDDVRDNAGHQMREILDAIFAKFAKKKRAEMVEKQAINAELKAQHKQEIDIAMQVYEKWQDKA